MKSLRPVSILPAAVLVAVLVPSTAAAVEPAFPGTELLGLGGKCLDVFTGGTEPGTPVLLFTCHGGDNQQWTVPLRGFEGPIVGVGGQCLEPRGGATTNRTPMQVGPCTGAPEQRFTHRLDGLLVGPGGKCVDVADGNPNDGAEIILFDCHGDANQRWREGGIDRFTPTGLQAAAGVHDLVVSPADPERVLVLTVEGPMLSVDGGDTWAPSGRIPSPLGQQAAFDPLDADTAYVGGPYRTTDGGRTWHWLGPDAEPSRRLWVHPVDPDRLVVSDAFFWRGSDRDLWHSDDGGVTWTRASRFLAPDRFGTVGGVAGDPRDPAVLLVAANREACKYCLADGGFFRSTDGGATWTQTSELDFTSLHRDPHDPDVLWAGTWDGPARSTDAGRSWRTVSVDPALLGVSDVALDPERPGRMLVAGHDTGLLFASDDGGASWRRLDPGVDYAGTVSVAFGAGGRIFLGLDHLDPQPNGGLWVSDDGGVTWSQRLVGFLAADVVDLAVSPADPDHALAAAISTVEATRDGGITWTPVFTPPAGDAATHVAFDRADPTRLYAAVDGTYGGQTTVQHSTDGGATWSAVATLDGAATRPWDLEVARLGGVTTAVVLFEVSPEPAILLLHTEGGSRLISSERFDVYFSVAVDETLGVIYLGGSADILRSDDGGATWSELAGARGHVAVDPSRPGSLYALHDVLRRSDDGGVTWSELSPTPAVFRDLEISADGEVWAETVTDGVYRSLDRGRTWTRSSRGLELGRRSEVALGPDGDVWVGSQERSPRRGRFGVAPPLELGDGRFTVEVGWRDFQGQAGTGRARAWTDDTGWFWFFDDQNVEAVVKVLDGTALNDHYWVFYASLSNVGLDVTVRDAWTGEDRTYSNPPGTFASFGDVEALPARGLVTPTAPTATPEPAGEPREAGSQLLLGDRFEAEVTWRDFQGQTGVGTALPVTDDTGAFWFFTPDNVELVVKVLDGTGVNGHWWVFYGSLSNVEFTLEVTDRVTGQSRRYENPLGTFASAGDVEAF